MSQDGEQFVSRFFIEKARTVKSYRFRPRTKKLLEFESTSLKRIFFVTEKWNTPNFEVKNKKNFEKTGFDCFCSSFCLKFFDNQN